MTLQNTRDVLYNADLTKWWIASEVNKQFCLGGLSVGVANYTANKWQALFFIGIWPAGSLRSVNKWASSSFNKKCIFSRLFLLNRGFGLKVMNSLYVFTVNIQKNRPLCVQFCAFKQLLFWWWRKNKLWRRIRFCFLGFFVCDHGW